MSQSISTSAKTDIETPDDIKRLVDTFYGRVQKDPLIGFIFDEVARVDWGTHLPKMYAFWGRVLLGVGNFQGNPMLAHLRLVPKTEMGPSQFTRWVELFHATIDDLFDGKRATHLKRISNDMAGMIHSRIHLPGPVPPAAMGRDY